MSELRESYINTLYKIPAAYVSFLVGIVIAVLVNYVTGSETPLRFWIFATGVFGAGCSFAIYVMRRKADQYYEKFLLDPDTLNEDAWKKATSSKKPGKANWFFACLTLATLSLFACFSLIVVDNFILPSVREQREHQVLYKLDQLDSASRLDRERAEKIYQLIASDSVKLASMKVKLDSILKLVRK